jgi:hypothetical protein
VSRTRRGTATDGAHHLDAAGLDASRRLRRAEGHSGSFRGRDEVVALLQKLVDVTEGTFQLEPIDFLNLDEHSAVTVRWSAERGGIRSRGREIAVYRLRDCLIAEVAFFNEPGDPVAFSSVFAFDQGEHAGCRRSAWRGA